ncbi:hypothetical protein VNO80_10666 [Phaseolus coccineus]|uniref:Uncharacterized protein n=1 Tax=Phaseolus coccineus TaxID=3886 RepID=A0AAN9NDT8_PHACN
MESAISLRYCPFPYSSKGFQGAGSIRFHLRFNHATPLCAPQFSTTRHPVTRSVGHANGILGRFSQPSQNDGRGSKIFRGVTGASLVLACLLGLFNFKMNPKLTTAHAFDLSSISDPSEVDDHGKMALKSLLEIMNDAEDATHQNETIPSQFNERGPNLREVHTLKSIAIGQSKSPKGRQALKTLEQQYNECKDNPEAEQYLIVALVEVFISQEKLEEASKMLDKPINQLLHTYSHIFDCKKCNECKKGNECKNKKQELSSKEKCDEMLKLYQSDDNEIEPNKRWIAQLILYKAIVHTMLEYKDAGKWIKGNKEALQWRKAFNQLF